MATLLQLVLDGPDRGGSLEMARQLADLVDAFELGPRLLQAEGPAFVNVLKGTVPDRPVACWAETEAGAQALRAGGSVAQVPWLLLYRPVALIAGSQVTAFPEPRRIVEAIRARMTVTPTMSHFY